MRREFLFGWFAKQICVLLNFNVKLLLSELCSHPTKKCIQLIVRILWNCETFNLHSKILYDFFVVVVVRFVFKQCKESLSHEITVTIHLCEEEIPKNVCKIVSISILYVHLLDSS